MPFAADIGFFLGAVFNVAGEDHFQRELLIIDMLKEMSAGAGDVQKTEGKQRKIGSRITEDGIMPE